MFHPVANLRSKSSSGSVFSLIFVSAFSTVQSVRFVGRLPERSLWAVRLCFAVIFRRQTELLSALLNEKAAAVQSIPPLSVAVATRAPVRPRTTQEFVRIAAARDWFTESIPPELVRLIAHYYVYGPHGFRAKWSHADLGIEVECPSASPGHTSGANDRVPVLTTVRFTSVESGPDLFKWRRMWGVHSFGDADSAFVTPYFAVRVRTGRPVFIGVSRHPCKPVECRYYYGCGEHEYGIYTDDTDNASRLEITGAHHMNAVSRLLKPAPPLASDAASGDGGGGGAGGAVQSKPQLAGSVIGVECDIEQNSVRFYLNDCPLLVTEMVDRGTRFANLSDGHLAIGSPYVITLPADSPLSEFYPYVSAFGRGNEMSLMSDWHPLQWSEPPVSSRPRRVQDRDEQPDLFS